MSAPLISLCMIAKDEADVIARCLRSAASAVDEIIVVDTGSTDGTPDIARGLGANVFAFPWQDDFALARNAALEHARGQWILILDADEELDPASAPKLRQLAASGGVEGFFVHVYNFAGDREDSPAVINPTIRLFRNHPQHRFAGRIHEQITPSIQARNPAAAFMLSDVRVNHYGYREEVIQRKNKTERNLLLLQETLKEKPNDPFHLYNIAVEWMRLGRVQEALEAFRTSRMTTDPKTSYAHLLYKCEAKCHLALRQFEQGAAICEQGAAVYPAYSDLYHYAGIFHLNRGDLAAAKDAFARAVKAGPPPSGYHTEEGLGAHLSAYQLGLLQEAALDSQAAADSYLHALRCRSAFAPPLYRLCHLLRLVGREADIVPLLLERIRVDDAGAATGIMDVMIATGCSRAALAWLERTKHLLQPDDIACRAAMAELLSGLSEDASERLDLLSRNSPLDDHDDTLRLRILICSMDGRHLEARQYWRQLTRQHASDRDAPYAAIVGEPADPSPGMAPGMSNAERGEWRDVLTAAHANAKHAASSRIAESWKSRIASAAPAGRIEAAAACARALSGLADAHLEQLARGRKSRELAGAVRLVLPFEDGSLA
ncbi:tetratricopeptide repeat-containing glycosyltransferase family 2 protein [Paenibacillus methanolicus]|uniref:Glycosyltransferase involved in cell wall biosynthesis n=1 Tax=Paenibacillus methanolicus TaxID=582686 RepID=A0A5S5CCV9_9BACL|nr:glycosyltransferase family 2 protein [Paenibacillus methanolicus]TYP76342.1 glycosyltransferase involved in cell wall biosynthesis [Paenibacillus methanolicus]